MLLSFSGESNRSYKRKLLGFFSNVGFDERIKARSSRKDFHDVKWLSFPEIGWKELVRLSWWLLAQNVARLENSVTNRINSDLSHT